MNNENERLIRLNVILGDKKHVPIIPVSKSTWWRGVKMGKYPQAVKLSSNITAWRASEVYALVNKGASDD